MYIANEAESPLNMKRMKEKHQTDADLVILVMKHLCRYIKQSKSAKSKISFAMSNRSKIPNIKRQIALPHGVVKPTINGFK